MAIDVVASVPPIDIGSNRNPKRGQLPPGVNEWLADRDKILLGLAREAAGLLQGWLVGGAMAGIGVPATDRGKLSGKGALGWTSIRCVSHAPSPRQLARCFHRWIEQAHPRRDPQSMPAIGASLVFPSRACHVRMRGQLPHGAKIVAGNYHVKPGRGLHVVQLRNARAFVAIADGSDLWPRR